MEPFVGSEALAAGILTRGALRWNYTAVHPNVYLSNGSRRDLYVNAVAAYLWTKRTGVVAGKAAAALHGVGWINDSEPIELIARHGRRRPGVVVYDEIIGDDEVIQRKDLRMTTPARTALDLARRLPRGEALQHLDALAARTGVSAREIGVLLGRYRTARGIGAARCIVDLMDGGALSPNQSQLRMMMLDAGLPKPRTGILLKDHLWEAVLAMGWEGPMVGLEHEDDLADMSTVQRIARDELFQRLGWFHIVAHRSHAWAAIVQRVRTAIGRRA
jgi:hypothetical protein